MGAARPSGGVHTAERGGGAADAVRPLNRYFEAIAAAVIAEEGLLDKFIGDALMAAVRASPPFTRTSASISAR